MKSLSKFELISLFAPMIVHMDKVIHVKDGKYGLPYGYLLNKVFDHFKIVCEKGVDVTIK